MSGTNNPERYLWKSGKPVFDIFKNLFSGVDSGDKSSISVSLKQKVADSGIDGLIEQRETLKERTQVVLDKISDWNFRKKDLAEQIDSIRAKFFISISDGLDPDTLTDEIKSLMAENVKLSEWISAAEKVVFENEKEIDHLDVSIGRAFGPVVLEQKKLVQEQIDKCSAEISKLYRDHFDSVRELSHNIKVPPHSGVWVKLSARIPRELIAPAFVGR